MSNFVTLTDNLNHIHTPNGDENCHKQPYACSNTTCLSLVSGVASKQSQPAQCLASAEPWFSSKKIIFSAFPIPNHSAACGRSFNSRYIIAGFLSNGRAMIWARVSHDDNERKGTFSSRTDVYIGTHIDPRSDCNQLVALLSHLAWKMEIRGGNLS